jgi:hypothetical protein
MTKLENNIADAINSISTAIEYQVNPFDTRSDFNGYSVADSLGIIADSMFRIAEALERKEG